MCQKQKYLLGKCTFEFVSCPRKSLWNRIGMVLFLSCVKPFCHSRVNIKYNLKLQLWVMGNVNKLCVAGLPSPSVRTGGLICMRAGNVGVNLFTIITQYKLYSKYL